MNARSLILSTVAVASFVASVADAAFIPTRAETSVSVYTGAGAGPWPSDSRYDGSMRLYDEINLSLGDSEVGLYGESADASADANMEFEVFGPFETLVASGSVVGHARNNDALVQNPNGSISHYRQSAAASSHSTFGFGFRVTTPYAYTFQSSTTGGSTTGNNVYVAFQGQGAQMAESGFLVPNFTYFISAGADGNASAPIPSCGANCLDSIASYARSWSLQLDVTPVPLPAAVWLLLSGVGVLGTVIRKRKVQ